MTNDDMVQLVGEEHDFYSRNRHTLLRGRVLGASETIPGRCDVDFGGRLEVADAADLELASALRFRVKIVKGLEQDGEVAWRVLPRDEYLRYCDIFRFDPGRFTDRDHVVSRFPVGARQVAIEHAFFPQYREWVEVEWAE